MTTPHTHNHDGPTPRQAIPVGEKLRDEALARLLGGDVAVPKDTIDRFIRQAPDLGIDLELMTAVVGGENEAPQGMRQVCMPIVGPGRTIMLFISPGNAKETPAAEQQLDRAAAIHAAIRLARKKHRAEAHLVQGLLEPRDVWAAQAYEAAGLTRLAELLYLSRLMRLGEARKDTCQPGRIASPEGSDWPSGITVRPMDPGPVGEARLHRALDASYTQTLDCPELAGMRTTADIVAAHRAVGEYDAALWWLVERTGEPEGCVLLNRCTEQGCVELVYIGLSPAVRGLGLGKRLMQSAIGVAAALEREMRCAVDVRNAPALRMYEALGFRESGRRVAFVGLVDDLLARNPSA